MKFLWCLLLFVPLIAAAGQDEDFLAARDAFRAGNAARFEYAAARLKNSVLEPYIAYYRLRMRLETADPATLRVFLARSDDTPVINRLRVEWLKSLGKHHQWALFEAEYPHLADGDTELECYQLQARRHTEEEAALKQARKLWLSSGDDLPSSCTPLFDAALAAGVIGPADVDWRLKLALEDGNVSLARQLSGRLPVPQQLPVANLYSAAENPQYFLARIKLEQATPPERRIALFALLRLAKQSPQLAYARWGRVSAYFNADEQRYFYSWLGYEAAIMQDARALEWFKLADGAPLNESQLAWRARAALRQLNWQEVHNSFMAMPPEQQQDEIWRYWNARALRNLGQREEANKIFAALSKEYNFYGQLAADEIGLAIAPGAMPPAYQPGKEALEAMQARPSIQRVIMLYRMDLRTDAHNEWAWAVRNFDDKQLLAAAEIARRNGMYDRAINTADRTEQLHDFSLRYLAPYRDVLRAPIRQNNLDEAWVYGLMRQESRFVTQAKSGVGASGLMQIMPSTARWVARKLGMRDYRKDLISRVDTNLIMGTYYMKSVLNWFDNSPVLASAAYNAGPAHARRWRGDVPLEGAIYAETIPFAETRDYVKKVMSNTVYYAQQFGQPPRTLKQRLGVIAAKNPANQLPIQDEK